MGSKLVASILVSLMLASVLPIMLTSTLSAPPTPVPRTLVLSPGGTPVVGEWITISNSPHIGDYGVAVTGAGENVYILNSPYSGTCYFMRYNTTLTGTDAWLPEPSAPPQRPKNGSAMAWDNGNYIYAVFGAAYDDFTRHYFYRYDISGDSWVELAPTPDPHGQSAGDAITWVPGSVLGVNDDNYIYAIVSGLNKNGDHGLYFGRYSIKNNSWEDIYEMNRDNDVFDYHTGGTWAWNRTDDGASLVWTGGDNLYMLRGEYHETAADYDFARFNLTDNRFDDSITTPESLWSPGGTGDGGSLLWIGGDYSDFIYALSGGTFVEFPRPNFCHYSISRNEWTRLADLPGGITDQNGPRLGFADNGDESMYIYCWRGFANSHNWKGKDYGDPNNLWVYTLPLDYGVSVSISPTSKQGTTETTLEYTVTVTNIGNMDDSYTLGVTETEDWNPTVPPSLLTIEAGDYGTATLSVMIPAGASAGDVNTITVTATDTGVSDSATCTAEVFSLTGSVDIFPTDDTHICEAYPDMVQKNDTTGIADGSRYNIYVGYESTQYDGTPTGKGMRIYLKFDLETDIPSDSTIDSAVLRLYNDKNVSDGYPDYNLRELWLRVHKVSNDDWLEGTLTWNIAEADHPCGENITPVLHLTSEKIWVEWDVTSYVQEQVTGDKIVSICMKNLVEADDNSVHFYSKDADPGQSRVHLKVDWSISVPGVDLSISPDENNAEKGQTVTFTVTVKNTGSVADNYTLENTDNTGWTLSIPSTVGPLSSQASEDVTLSVTIPGDATAGTQNTVTVTAESQDNENLKDTATCTVTVEEYGVSVSIEPDENNAENGQTVTFTVTVKNTGSVADTYTLENTDSADLNWTMSLETSTVGALSSQASEDVTLSVTIPGDATGGTQDTVTVTAESQENPGVTATDTCTVTVEVVEEYGVSVSISPDENTGKPGDALAYTVTITNTGETDDAYTLDNIDNAGWVTLSKTSTTTLAKNESDTATLTVEIPAGADNGYVDNITVTATSQADGSVKASATCTATVEVEVVEEYGVSVAIEPASRRGAAGGNLTYTVTVKNLENTGTTTYDLDNTDTDNWALSLDNTTLSVAAGENETTTLRVTIPDNVVIGDNDVITVTATSATDNTISDSATCTATVAPEHDVSVSISPDENTGASGDNLTYTVTINNIGVRDDNYNLTAESDNTDWLTYLSENTVGPLSSDEDNTVTLKVTIPENASPGDSATITVTATSQENENVKDNASCTATVELAYGVEVSISPENLERLPGDEVIYTVTVTNTGGIGDNYNLTVTDNAGWNPALTTYFMEIAAKGSDNVTLTVTIPDNAGIGEVDEITVTATSVTDNTVSDNDTCTATAVFEYTIQISFIPGGENRVANFENENIPVLEVKIIVENSEGDLTGTITVTVLENIEGAVPPGMVRRYLNIVTSIPNTNIKGLLAKFRVSKSWVARNGIDEGTIRMFENTENSWLELTTERLVDLDDNTYLYFQAEAQGLSLFAITGGKAAPTPILLIMLAVVAASAGGVGAAVVWYRPKLPSLPRPTIRLPRIRPKEQIQLRLPEGIVKDIDKWIKEGRFRNRGDAIRTILATYDERERTRDFYKMLAERSGEAKKKSKSLATYQERERTRDFYKMLAERSSEAKKKPKSLVPLEEGD